MTDTTKPTVFRKASSTHFEDLVRLMSGRNVPALIVARLEPDRGPDGTFMNIYIEHIMAVGDVIRGNDVIVRDGEDLMNRLGGGELSRLVKSAEKAYYMRLDRFGDRSRPISERL